MCTCKDLEAKPEHGSDSSGCEAGAAEPETEQRSVESLGRLHSTKDSVDESDNQVTSESYCRKSLSPET